MGEGAVRAVIVPTECQLMTGLRGRAAVIRSRDESREVWRRMTDITKTQHGLARKAIAQNTHRFDDLYHLLCKREWIETALQQVLSNDGAVTAGVDGRSWRDFYDVEKSDFERDRFREQFIATLQRDLKVRTFQPEPVRRVEIPKPGTHKTGSWASPPSRTGSCKPC